MNNMIFSKGLFLAGAVLLSFGCSCPKASAEFSAPVKVILDCDMGYMNDDVLCLSMLLKAEEKGLVEILGITLTGGNHFINASYVNYGETQFGSAKNTEEFLAAVNRADIPVFRGTDYPTDIGRQELRTLDTFYHNLNYAKFNDGYGAIHFFGSVDPDLLCDSNAAADFLIRSVHENPGEVVIFAIGPTMNIAKAVKQDPDFAPNVKAVYCMGGAIGEHCMMETADSRQAEGIIGANVTPITEYNVLYDPSAFETMITAPFPKKYLFPGCCRVNIDEGVAGEIIVRGGKGGVSARWSEHYKEYIQPYPYWDPMTAYAFLCPDAVKRSAVGYVTVDSDRLSDTFGRTVSISADEYEKLPPEQQALYGQAEIIYEMSGFWDYAVNLLCG
ncbi:MAG: nucleoside hydrolase [Eubacteriales bacterium]|nr:nucleoside hydrolase [Eubacteriales bacterium]